MLSFALLCCALLRYVCVCVCVFVLLCAGSRCCFAMPCFASLPLYLKPGLLCSAMLRFMPEACFALLCRALLRLLCFALQLLRSA